MIPLLPIPELEECGQEKVQSDVDMSDVEVNSPIPRLLNVLITV
jgi:hypothetical protein